MDAAALQNILKKITYGMPLMYRNHGRKTNALLLVLLPPHPIYTSRELEAFKRLGSSSRPREEDAASVRKV